MYEERLNGEVIGSRGPNGGWLNVIFKVKV